MVLPILFQDSDVVVVNKPSGLLVHRSAVDRFATEFAMQILRDQIGQHVYTVHRLDRATSGALVFALSTESARALSTEFEQGNVEKKYLAVVRGTTPEESLIDYPLKEELDKKTDRLARADKEPQSAITKIKTIATCEVPVMVDKYPTSRYSLVEAIPKTGRKHQIRRHLRHLGHPIIGDTTHGAGKHNRFFESEFGNARMLLACTEISFQHPRTGQILSVTAPLSDDYSRVIQKLGWKFPLGKSIQ